MPGFATYNFTTGTATELGEFPFQIDFNGCQGCGNGTYGAGGFAFASACLAPPSNMVAWYSLDVPGSSEQRLQPDLVNANTATSYGNPRAEHRRRSIGRVAVQRNLRLCASAGPIRAGYGRVRFVHRRLGETQCTTGGVVSLVDKRQSQSASGVSVLLVQRPAGTAIGRWNGSGLQQLRLDDRRSGRGNHWHLVAVTVQRSAPLGERAELGTWMGMRQGHLIPLPTRLSEFPRDPTYDRDAGGRHRA